MTPEFVATSVLRVSLLLALGLAALRWLPEARPQWRRTAALLCLLASLVAPFLPVMNHHAMAGSEWHRWSGTAISRTHAIHLAQFLLVLWITGTLWAALRLVRRGMALHRWMNGCIALPADDLPVSGVGRLAVRMCRRAKAPCVAGFLRPTLIVPEQARAWDDTTWRCVMAHEIQHIRQGDLWLGWIAHLARVLYWWHPLAWSLTRRMGLECEACCDDAVLRLGVKAADYARVLLGFTNVDLPAVPAPAYSIQGRTPSSLRVRVERLLAGGAVRAPAWRAFALATLLLVGVGSCLWLGFERAQSPSPTELKDEAALRWNANPFPGDDG